MTLKLTHQSAARGQNHWCWLRSKVDKLAHISLSVCLGNCVEACMCIYLYLPNIVVFLDVDLVEHHIFLLGIDISLHLHGNMPWQH